MICVRRESSHLTTRRTHIISSKSWILKGLIIIYNIYCILCKAWLYIDCHNFYLTGVKSISFKKGSVGWDGAPSRRVCVQQSSSMEAASACCEHIHRSLMKVPGLLGQQLFTTNKAAVITEHSFLKFSPQSFYSIGSFATRSLSPVQDWLSTQQPNINNT